MRRFTIWGTMLVIAQIGIILFFISRPHDREKDLFRQKCREEVGWYEQQIKVLEQVEADLQSSGRLDDHVSRLVHDRLEECRRQKKVLEGKSRLDFHTFRLDEEERFEETVRSHARSMSFLRSRIR